MASSRYTDDSLLQPKSSVVREDQIEARFIEKLRGLKYEFRGDITDRATLERNFREKFETLNRVRLTDVEFARLLDEIVTPDVLSRTILAATLKHNEFLKELGLSLLP